MNNETHSFVTNRGPNYCCLLCGEPDEHPNHGKSYGKNRADSTSKAVPPQGLTRFDVTFADKIARHPEGNFMFYADHAAELERLSKERDDALANADFWERELNNFRRNAAHRAEQLAKEKVEAAESKLSQLQLSNEEKAKKIADELWPAVPEYAYPRILAILNGGQQ